MENKTLAERIAQERLNKSQAQPRSLRQLGRNPESINFDLQVQRNLRWTDLQVSELIESILLGFPIPPVYTVKSNDNITWCIDGKQRIKRAIIPFMRDEIAIVDNFRPVFGADISGLKFSQLPPEFQEILEEERIVFYQFDRIEPYQIEEMFKRLNSGTPLTRIELIRSILGAETLDWFDTVTVKKLFSMMNNMTEAAREKFYDQEILLQICGILNGDYAKQGGKALEALALDLRINGISDELKTQVVEVIDYLTEGFSNYEEKEQRRLLKKNDVVALCKAAVIAIKYGVDPKEFAGLTGSVIVKNGHYKATKIGGTTSEAKVRKRVELLIESLNISVNEQKIGQLEMEV